MKKILTILFAVALGLNLSAQEECMNPDVNCDGYVNVNDLLGLLGYFGDEDLDGDGIWDSQDDCVDDGCGVCGGPGPQVLAVDTITFATDSTFIEVINEWYVFEIPDTTFTLVCTNPGCTDPTAENFDSYASEDDGSCTGIPCIGEYTVTYDGYDYATVQIGDQCWFTENLRNEYYANGAAIPGGLSESEWVNTTQGAMTIYSEGTMTVYAGSNDEEANLNDYGRLYNWYAVQDSSGLCPSGWHVPTDEEFMTLEMELGMSELEVNSTGNRGTDQGVQMKSSPEDQVSWDGTNTSGFSGSAGGWLAPGGAGGYFNGEFSGHFWTTSSIGNNIWTRGLSTGYSGVDRGNNWWAQNGLSVRCVRD